MQSITPRAPLRALTLAAALALAGCAATSQPGDTGAVPRAQTSAGTLSTAAPRLVREVEGIQEWQLGNGLQVLLVPDASKPTTTVNLTYRVGSRHENYGETGMAHLLEHLIFKGTPTNPNVWAEFSRRGMRPNGTTWVDRTNYFASFAANPDTLKWYLGWQADAMVNSFIAKKDLDSEMTVVRNEMESGENNPMRVLLTKTLAAMYDWHNYGKSTIGARADVENVDIARLQAFYRKYYQPDNATLVVAGAFDPKQTMGWVQQAFGGIAKPARKLEPTYTLDPVQDGERQVTVRRVGGTPTLLMGYHAPAAGAPAAASVQLLSSILGGTPNGRLHRKLVEGKLAAGTFGFQFDTEEPGPLFFGAQLAPGQDIGAARKAMDEVLDGLAAQPVTAEELERARLQYLKDWELGFTDPERVGIQLSEAVAAGDWRLFFLTRDWVRNASLADVQKAGVDYLKPDNRTVGLYLPTAAPQRAPAPARADVAAAVKDYKGDAAATQAEAFDPTPANLDARTQTSRIGGLKVALLPKGTRGGAVQAQLTLRFGDEKALFGQESVGSFLGQMYERGAAGMTRQQIADAFDKLRADVSISISGQTLSAGITTTRANLPAAVELLGRVLRQPTLDAGAIEEQRSQWLAGIEAQRKEPGALASNALGRHANPYPKGDLRYVPTFDEMVESTKVIDRARLQAFQQRFISAAQGEFAAVGDMDAAAVQQALRTGFGDWTQPAAGALPFTRVPSPMVPNKPERIVIRTPDKANANLALKMALPLDTKNPDHAALMVGSRIVGYLGTGLLWQKVREQQGLSYDVRSGLGFGELDVHSTFSGSAIFAPQNQPKVEAAYREVLERSVRDGFTAAQFEDARRSLLASRRLGRAQDGAVAGALVSNQYLGRTFVWDQQVDDALAKLTLDQVNAAWKRWIDPSQLVWVWAGDFK